MLMNKDAARIKALPHRNHPYLTAFVDHLAAHEAVDLKQALGYVELAMKELGIGDLDIEMAQPGAQTFVSFAPSKIEAGSDFQQSVERHIQSMLQGGRR